LDRLRASSPPCRLAPSPRPPLPRLLPYTTLSRSPNPIRQLLAYCICLRPVWKNISRQFFKNSNSKPMVAVTVGYLLLYTTSTIKAASPQPASSQDRKTHDLHFTQTHADT